MEPRNAEQPMTLGYFCGGVQESYLQFLDKFRLLAWSLQWDNDKKIRMFPGYLKGVAQDAYLALPDEVRQDWDQLKQALLDRFMPPEHLRLAQTALINKQQRPDESVAAYATAVEKLAREAFPTMPTEHRKDLIRMHFVNGLRPGLRQRILTSHPGASYDDVFAASKSIEAGLTLTESATNWASTTTEYSTGNDHRVFAGFTPKQPKGAKGNLGHSMLNSSQKRFQWSASGKPICSACQVEGHIKRFCPNMAQEARRNIAQSYYIAPLMKNPESMQYLTVVDDEESEVEVLRRQVKALQDRKQSKAGF